MPPSDPPQEQQVLLVENNKSNAAASTTTTTSAPLPHHNTVISLLEDDDEDDEEQLSEPESEPEPVISSSARRRQGQVSPIEEYSDEDERNSHHDDSNDTMEISFGAPTAAAQRYGRSPSPTTSSRPPETARIRIRQVYYIDRYDQSAADWLTQDERQVAVEFDSALLAGQGGVRWLEFETAWQRWVTRYLR